MVYVKIICILLLLYIISNNKVREGFLSDDVIKQRAVEIYTNKELFKSGVKYTTVKNNLPWIDSVVFYDAYKMKLNGDMSISNLEKIIS